ncbi:signal peptidase I [Aestuariibacter halophilus]|uniref:Signal peptidase I n=1 Tax=Fluctibacter halophilus TaxID=226011 RepID=A0ABS8G293_9ALTE|nr:signal peptidase I [Aestuariibacter halophilus]MCC2614702.1 signal peptidase I [Aestuariibacter halophilus]
MANYFSIFLVLLTVGSGLIWLADALWFAPKRKARFAHIQSENDVQAAAVGEPPLPYVVDTAQQIFPVIAFVLVLRSFLYEPFQIPSGSMMPTLLVGDFILVEKFSYGLKDPVARHKFIETGTPQRGDIVVFKYPKQPNLDYIKRVVGLPGDTVVYKNKQIFIKPACDGQTNCPPLAPVSQQFVQRGEWIQNGVPLMRFSEQLGEVNHDLLRNPDRISNAALYFPQRGTQSNEWIVPEGEYFVMGDNRDNSEDSRYWGFVPDDNLVGKAVAIWISFEFERGADSWLPSWVPTGVRFNRIGGIE